MHLQAGLHPALRLSLLELDLEQGRQPRLSTATRNAWGSEHIQLPVRTRSVVLLLLSKTQRAWMILEGPRCLPESCAVVTPCLNSPRR